MWRSHSTAWTNIRITTLDLKNLFYFEYRLIRNKMAPAKAAKNAQYCKKYIQKNLEEIRKNDWERKKFQKEYREYYQPKKHEEYLKKERERKQKGTYVPRLPNCGDESYWNIIYHWNPDGTWVTIPASTEMRKMLAILINTPQLSCLTGEVVCKMWYYFFAFCHVFVFFVFLKLVLDVLSYFVWVSIVLGSCCVWKSTWGLQVLWYIQK